MEFDEDTAEALYAMRQAGILRASGHTELARVLLRAKAADFGTAQPIILAWLSRGHKWELFKLAHKHVLKLLGLTEAQARAMLAKLELQRIRRPRRAITASEVSFTLDGQTVRVK
jgi:hypothetical protein